MVMIFDSEVFDKTYFFALHTTEKKNQNYALNRTLNRGSTYGDSMHTKIRIIHCLKDSGFLYVRQKYDF